MKLNLFLSVVVFTIFRLCKAGPLRHHLEKRAAFYIANETACVVDNIVYTSGDPIPTDDPCEACRCRPPGFACVLKECKIKPGCRAVRHAGQCCPEYICGCEHNGKFYQDGDEIKDPKNPCYQCYCQGSSIACAFVDCIYRDECDSVFVPGECCPQYVNCTTDIPDRNLFLGGNVFPSANLLPVFNDESVLPQIPSADQVVELPENPRGTIQPQEPNDSTEKVLSSESSETEDGVNSSTSETAEPESFVTEVKSSNTEIKEKETETESLESSEEEKQEEKPKENENKETAELIEGKNVLLNSESDVIKDDVTESSQAQNIKITTEEELPQTTVESKSKETADEAAVTEKTTEIETISTETEEKEPQIKNSASENSKSLKLTDDDQLEETKKEQQNIKSDTKTDGEVITELESESTNAVLADDLKESSTVESKKQSEDNVAEESQTNAQATPLSINNAKIKSESAETVTIVVHVKESSKIPTETDFIAETVTPLPVTSTPEENLLKSHDNIISTGSEKKATEIEDNKSTNTNFEVFPTTKQISETEPTSKSPSTDKNSENIQGRSDEADNIALEAEENPVSEEKVSDLKSEDDSSVKTTTMGSTEIDKEVRTDEEVTEETKTDEPTRIVIRVDTSNPITIEITDSVSSPKPEKSTTELENESSKITGEKESNTEETVVPEVREVADKLEEDLERATTTQSEEQSTTEEKSSQLEKVESTTEKEVLKTEEKVQESTPTNIDENPETRTNDEVETDKNEEKTITDKSEEKTTKKSKTEATTESQNQTTEGPKQTTSNDNQ